MSLTRTELEILAGEREKFSRELVDNCLKNFRKLGFLRGDKLIDDGLKIFIPHAKD